jgi:ser/thr/tyr protein kinase RAD53
LQTKGGTEGYIAPEISRHDEPDDIGSSQYSHLVDIWSAGCVIFRLLSGGVPEDDKNSKKFHSDVPQFLREKLGKLDITEECFHALEGMLQVDASKRLTAENALRTAWLIGRGESRTIV